VTQRFPPASIVQGDQRQTLRNPWGCHGGRGAIPDSVLQQLNSTERTFAAAWVTGRQPKTTRPGEGLSWDAEGFEPPDAPTRGSKR
jgi:hypothetical protein